MAFTQYICYLTADQREYLAAQKAAGRPSVSEVIREAIDLHRELRGAGERKANALTDSLCRMIDAMEPRELQQTVKAVWAVREAYKAGQEAGRNRAGGKGATAPPRSGKPTAKRRQGQEGAPEAREHDSVKAEPEGGQ